VLLKHIDMIVDAGEEVCRDGERGVRVFVPLCGKSVDMRYLAEKKGIREVIGLDGVQKALQEFQVENPSLQITKDFEDDRFVQFRGNNITLLKGDYFDLNRESFPRVDAIWDRASIVAIRPSLREEYVRIMGEIIRPGGLLLLSTLDRRSGTTDAKNAGPPFSVDEAEVWRLYKSLDWVASIEKIGETNQLEERFEAAGLTAMFGLTFAIRAKPT